MSPLRVYHLDDAASWRGGEQQVLYLHQGLLVHDVDSRIVCRRGGALHERLEQQGLPHYALGLRGAHDLASARAVARLVGNEPGILHTHTSHAHDLGLWISRFSGRPPLVVSRRVDFAVGGNPLSRWKYLNRRVHRYLAISSAVETALLNAGVEPQRIRRVPSGIDLSRFTDVQPARRWRAKLGLKPSELLFGNVAALAPHKDHATLLDAFARFLERGGKAKLVILGEGELRPSLEKQIERLGLTDSVHLAGFVDDVLERMWEFDLFVLSSYLEGLGTSILDAMALGLPVVATRTGGIVDAVDHGVTGLLVPPRSPEEMATALLTMEKNVERRREMGHAGRERVADFDVQRTVELTLDAYREL